MLHPGVILQYEDEDHDKVVLASDSDLVAAVDHARSAGWKVQPICIVFCHLDNGKKSSL